MENYFINDIPGGGGNLINGDRNIYPSVFSKIFSPSHTLPATAHENIASC